MRRSHPPLIDVLNLWRFTLGGGLNGWTLKTAGVLLKMNKLFAIVAPLFVASTAMAQEADAAASSSALIPGLLLVSPFLVLVSVSVALALPPVKPPLVSLK